MHPCCTLLHNSTYKKSDRAICIAIMKWEESSLLPYWSWHTLGQNVNFSSLQSELFTLNFMGMRYWFSIKVEIYFHISDFWKLGFWLLFWWICLRVHESNGKNSHHVHTWCKAFVSNIAFVHAPCKNRSNPINVITIWNVIIQFSRLSGKVHLGDKKRSRLWP